MYPIYKNIKIINFIHGSLIRDISDTSRKGSVWLIVNNTKINGQPVYAFCIKESDDEFLAKRGNAWVGVNAISDFELLKGEYKEIKNE